MVSEAELIKRRAFYFRKSPGFQVHGTVEMMENDLLRNTERSFKMIVGWHISIDGGFKHAFILSPTLECQFGPLLRDGYPMRPLQRLLEDVGVQTWNSDPLLADRVDFKSAPFTKRVYVFTGALKEDRAKIKAAFRSHGLEAIVIDDERWKAEWDKTPADVFLCHDSRDKARFAHPLYAELVQRNFKVWLDEYAINPGNDVVKKIDHGLGTSRHAILLLTKRFLRNDRWASQEMSALLSRQFGTKREDLIIPLYIGVSWADVHARSSLLAKTSPVKTSAINFSKRVKDVVDEICRTVRPGDG